QMPSSSVKNTVDILIKGYVDGRRATGTVTLVNMMEHGLILVDAGDPWNGDELREKLKERGYTPDQVDVVVITHGHIDHCGNVSMFKKARFFMDGDCATKGVRGGEYEQSKFIEEDMHYLTPLVWIERRVGHTASDLIVVVGHSDRGGITVVAGDLFEDENDEEKWKENSQYPEEQETSREYVRQKADWIVPGHGDIFKVNKGVL
ncbi:hypothetical protein PENTCL1PPCAC_27149, partial [Pristionchus entomophagus]